MTSSRSYADLGPYSDLVDVARANHPLFPSTPLTPETARALLRFTFGDERPIDLKRVRTWEQDGVVGEELSWSVGFGPPTHAFLLKPAGVTDKLPGVVACYDHGHFKFFGKEKIADGPDGAPAVVGPFRDLYYSGRAYANALAREGFAVLVHDTFLWGSRKFPLEAMPPGDLALADQVGATLGHGAIDGEVLRYHGAAFLHEHLIAKYLNIFGASLAALTAYEDRVALNVLAERDDVDATRVAAVGFSGGGLRAAAVSATSDRLKATIVAGMMTTYEELLSRHIVPHTWMLFPAGLAQAGDMPDLAACAAPRPLMVVYALEDPLFTEKGMRDADARISEYYERAGVRENYRGVFFGGPHRFDREMQERVFQWLKERL
jgi:dienelactone hydrolase